MTSEPISEAGPRLEVVREAPIELCHWLKCAGLTESGGAAKQLIADGRVQVNDALESRQRRKILAGDRVAPEGASIVVQVG